jgi:hypothetical protein
MQRLLVRLVILCLALVLGLTRDTYNEFTFVLVFLFLMGTMIATEIKSKH